MTKIIAENNKNKYTTINTVNKLVQREEENKIFVCF